MLPTATDRQFAIAYLVAKVGVVLASGWCILALYLDAYGLLTAALVALIGDSASVVLYRLKYFHISRHLFSLATLAASA